MEYTNKRQESLQAVEIDEQDLAEWTLEDDWSFDVSTDGENFLKKLRELVK